MDKLELKAGDQVLEVSVGTGANLSYVAERIGPTGKIYGIDISEGMLAQARKKLAGIPCPVDLQSANAEDLPFPSDCFDAVLSFGAMNFKRQHGLRLLRRQRQPNRKHASLSQHAVHAHVATVLLHDPFAI
ncbi:MAG: methyltransferase domain-containing protein [Chloroflexi bacterium]|nr:methyltransferase domain-containing protein [Chloroflexota bacterium]